LKAEFRRYFDTGYIRRVHQDILSAPESDQDRGWRFFRALLRELYRRDSVHLIPYAFVQTCTKFAGYRLGRLGLPLPVRLKQRLSGQDYYWTSEVFQQLNI
jgi:rhamnosyltransferase